MAMISIPLAEYQAGLIFYPNYPFIKKLMAAIAPNTSKSFALVPPLTLASSTWCEHLLKHLIV